MAHCTEWQLNLGAEICPQGVRFRVWAPKCQQVEVVIADRKHTTTPLSAEENGYFSGIAPQIERGALYPYRLDGEQQHPDPCSRFQP